MKLKEGGIMPVNNLEPLTFDKFDGDKELYLMYILHHVATNLTRLAVTHACVLDTFNKMVELQEEMLEEE
jgi:hypothetical protein